MNCRYARVPEVIIFAGMPCGLYRGGVLADPRPVRAKHSILLRGTMLIRQRFSDVMLRKSRLEAGPLGTSICELALS